MSTKKRVIACTADTGFIALISDVCHQCNLDVIFFKNGHELLKSLETLPSYFIILDINAQEPCVIDILNLLSGINSHLPIIIVGDCEERVRLSVQRLGALKGLVVYSLGKQIFKAKSLINIIDTINKNSDYINDEHIANALEKKQFRMFYQPKIAIKSKQLVGVEALIRWDRPYHGMISPDFFIPIAEKSGLIIPLTYWIIREVFSQYAVWKKKELGIKFAINLTPNILTDLLFPEELAKLTKEFHVNPQHICFEITESAAMHSPDVVLEVLTRIRLKGFLLSIDDFGTGYSSLVELQRLPFTELKIDKSFVNNIESNQLNWNIVRSVINLAQNMDLAIVAEGVETRESLQHLDELGCDVIQGYLISKPMSVDNFIIWLNDKVDANGIFSG